MVLFNKIFIFTVLIFSLSFSYTGNTIYSQYDTPLVVMSAGDYSDDTFVTPDGFFIETRNCYSYTYWQRAILRTLYIRTLQNYLVRKEELVFNSNHLRCDVVNLGYYFQ